MRFAFLLVVLLFSCKAPNLGRAYPRQSLFSDSVDALVERMSLSARCARYLETLQVVVAWDDELADLCDDACNPGQCGAREDNCDFCVAGCFKEHMDPPLVVMWPENPEVWVHEITHAALACETGNPDAQHEGPMWGSLVPQLQFEIWGK